MSLSKLMQSNTDLHYPTVKPKLDLNFTRKSLGIDPAYTFTRNSSGTYIDADGSFKTVGVNQPRFDHDPVTSECKGLLIEEGRTNYFYASNDLDNAFYWNPENTTITLDGTNKRGNYYKIRGTMNGLFVFGVEGLYRGLASKFDGGQHNLNVVPVGSTVTLSMDAKVPDDETGTRNIYFTALATFGQTGGYIDEFFATVSNDSNSGIDLGNGWRRYSNTFPWMTSVNFGGGSAAFVKINPRFSQFQHVLISNLQLEVGTTPTSYIPTTTSGLTRQPEQLVLNNAPISNQGTFFIESNPTTGVPLVADNGTSSLTINSPLNQYTKSVLYYNTNRTLRMSSDNSVPSDYIYTNPQDINRVSLGFNRLYSINYINGHIKKFSYYANPLTEDNLRAITSNKVSIFRSNDGPIVTNGLVLYLDAGNPVSYPGSGTTWTDLSGNVNNGTLVNGVGYSATNGGSLSFDGDNDYVEIIGNASNTPSSMTLFCFIYPENTTPEEIIAVQNNGGGYRFFTKAYNEFQGINWGFQPKAYPTPTYEASELSNNTWHCLAVTYTTSNIDLYLNGNAETVVNNLPGSYPNPPALVHGGNIRLGFGIGVAQGYLQGNLPVFMMYNRALTSQEIQQNFNALRGRFGI